MGHSEAASISATWGLREVLSMAIKHLLGSHRGLSPGGNNWGISMSRSHPHPHPSASPGCLPHPCCRYIWSCATSNEVAPTHPCLQALISSWPLLATCRGLGLDELKALPTQTSLGFWDPAAASGRVLGGRDGRINPSLRVSLLCPSPRGEEEVGAGVAKRLEWGISSGPARPGPALPWVRG